MTEPTRSELDALEAEFLGPPNPQGATPLERWRQYRVCDEFVDWLSENVDEFEALCESWSDEAIENISYFLRTGICHKLKSYYHPWNQQHDLIVVVANQMGLAINTSLLDEVRVVVYAINVKAHGREQRLSTEPPVPMPGDDDLRPMIPALRRSIATLICQARSVVAASQ
ncbi:MAG: hypothetical protein AAF078_06260, partial [Planctomycetota bacterium]